MKDSVDGEMPQTLTWEKHAIQPPGQNGTALSKYSSIADTLAEGEDSKQPQELSKKRDLSNFRSFLHLFRVSTGPSTLGTAKIMQNGGIVLGPILFVIFGYMNTFCTITLIKCSRLLCERLGRSAMTYEDVVEESILLYPRTPWVVRASKVARCFTWFSLLLCQLGLMSVIIKIIAGAILQEVRIAIPSFSISFTALEAMIAVCLIPYGWIRNLKLLSWSSFIGNICVAVYAVTILQWSLRNLKDPDRLPYVTPNLWTLPLLAGGTIFTVEGIPMVLPVENRAKNPQDFIGPCGLMMLAGTLNICMNAAVGFYGYLALGDQASGNILLQLPRTPIYSAANIPVAVMLFLTFTIQLYQPAEAISEVMHSRWPASHVVQVYGNKIARTGLVIASYLICSVVPRVDMLMALVGSCCTTILVFFLPVMAEMLIECRDTRPLPWAVLAKGFVMITFGLMLFVFGLYTSLLYIVHTLFGP